MVQGAVLPKIKRPGRETHQVFPASAEVKNSVALAFSQQANDTHRVIAACQ
jgi:hypothetical protein